MRAISNFRNVIAEFFGAALLLMSIIGSGIMAANLTTDIGIQLIINMLATVLTLGIIIFIFAPISGAQFNPLVTLVELYHKRIDLKNAAAYILAQFSGATVGTMLANLMFEKPAIFHSNHIRSGTGVLLGEILATAGLIFLIQMLGEQSRSDAAWVVIPAWVGSGFFFTSSFIFANPAVTFARAWSDTFAGIAPSSVPNFILAELIGAVLGVIGAQLFIGQPNKNA